jgi:hypothetical protein
MTDSNPARGGVWAQFFAADPGAPVEVPVGGRVDRYHVDAVERRAGAAVADLAPGATLVRVEGPGPRLPLGRGFRAVGVVQHVLYTGAERRKELAAVSTGERGPRAVLIPIAKSDAWWALAQDEREAFFRRASDRPGHVEIGAHYAGSIFRRLYQARYQPGSQWDFLTYFELTDGDAGTFRELLAALRDPGLNPEWGFVERETEIWMTRV